MRHIAWSPGSYSKEWVAPAAYDKVRLICVDADYDDVSDVNKNHEGNDHHRALREGFNEKKRFLSGNARIP